MKLCIMKRKLGRRGNCMLFCPNMPTIFRRPLRRFIRRLNLWQRRTMRPSSRTSNRLPLPLFLHLLPLFPPNLPCSPNLLCMQTASKRLPKFPLFKRTNTNKTRLSCKRRLKTKCRCRLNLYLKPQTQILVKPLSIRKKVSISNSPKIRLLLGSCAAIRC